MSRIRSLFVVFVPLLVSATLGATPGATPAPPAAPPAPDAAAVSPPAPAAAGDAGVCPPAGAAGAAAAGTGAACQHNPAAEAALVEEQQGDERRQRLTRLEAVHGQRLAETLPARLDALVVGQQRALEAWAFREAYRQTRACLADAVTEPFCAAVKERDRERCKEVPVADGGAVHQGACAVAVAIRDAFATGEAAPCARLEGGLDALCRVIVTGRWECDTLPGGAADPPQALCRLLADPAGCSGAAAQGQACALAAFVRALRGETSACEGIPEASFPRLRAACRAATGAEPTCPPDATAAPALGRCAVAEPWPATASRQGDRVVVQAALANVLSQELRCYAESRLRQPDGSETPLPDEPFPAVPPGEARLHSGTVAVPAGAAGEPVVRLRCAWKRAHPGDVPQVRPFGGPSQPDPGGGAPPKP